MKNYIQPGEVITIPAPSAYTSGAIVAIGSLVGVAAGDASQGDPLDVARAGVFTLPKNGTDAFAVGDNCYYDATNKVVVAASDGNTLVGTVVVIAAATAAVVSVLIR